MTGLIMISTMECTRVDLLRELLMVGFWRTLILMNCSSQEAYEKAVTTLFKSLDRAEEHLANNPGPYYHGERVTEADVRLFTVSIPTISVKFARRSPYLTDHRPLRRRLRPALQVQPA